MRLSPSRRPMEPSPFPRRLAVAVLPACPSPAAARQHRMQEDPRHRRGVFAALIVIGTIATVLNPAELRQALATSPVATRSAVAKVTPAPSRHHTGRHKPSKAVRAAKRTVTWYTGAGGGELHAVDAQLAAMVRAGRSGNFAAAGRACGRLAAVVGDAQAEPAIPDMPPAIMTSSSARSPCIMFRTCVPH